MQTKSLRRVFSKGLTNNLLELGHKIVKVETNPKDTQKVVFVFENNDNFQSDLNDILNK